MYIPSVPFPDFVDIAKALFENSILSLDPAYLDNRKTSYQYYSCGSEALACICQSIGGCDSVVFVPSYFCNSSLDDLRSTAARIIFYNTNTDLTPDWDHIDQLTGLYAPDIFVLVHYFGSINELDGAEEFCRINHCKLVHDCAHHLLPCEQILDSPGLVFFSPHKLLPVPSLSFVVSGQDDIDVLGKPETTTIKVFDCIWLVKRFLQKYMSVIFGFKQDIQMPKISGDIMEKKWMLSPVSRFSLLLFSAASRHLEFVGRQRHKNYDRLHKVVLSSANNEVVETKIQSRITVPYAYVFSVPADKQDQVFRYMREQDVPVNIWPDLPPEVLMSPDVYASTIALRKTLLLLPVQQSLTRQQMDHICNVLPEIHAG